MYKEEQKKLIDKLTDIDKLNKEMLLLSVEVSHSLNEIKKVQTEIKIIIDEKSKGFPWLADRIAEYFEMRDNTIAEYLEKKFRPAQSTAERVKELAKEKRILKKEFLIARNFIAQYESLFPWITEYVGDDFDELIKQVEENENKDDASEEDPVLRYVPKAEYLAKPESERNQIALDRYLNSRKRYAWQVGRDYERYVGYLFEVEGYDVYYQGIEKGLEDLGRDLVCKKGGVIEIVQCKFWAQHKTIHEKHINQLFGTTVKYYLDFVQKQNSKTQLELFPDLLKSGLIRSKFITSTKLSPTAKQFAEALGIIVIENFPMKEYPIIKCNLANDGGKIYHLPFDQKYDDTKISKKGEYYVKTVAEAEKLGFRRAWKWHGNK